MLPFHFITTNYILKAHVYILNNIYFGRQGVNIRIVYLEYSIQDIYEYFHASGIYTTKYTKCMLSMSGQEDAKRAKK